MNEKKQEKAVFTIMYYEQYNAGSRLKKVDVEALNRHNAIDKFCSIADRSPSVIQKIIKN